MLKMSGGIHALVLAALFAAVICGGCGDEAGVTLVSDGEPAAVIVIDSEAPTRSAQLAAYELQHVIKLITGAELPIVGCAGYAGGAAILAGESGMTRELGFRNADFEGEEYIVEFAGDKIILMGNDSPDYGKVDYSDHATFPPLEYTYRSTMYAAYDFLEKCCGARFYSYGDDGTAFMERATLEVNPVSIRYSPHMDAFRKMSLQDRGRSFPAVSQRDVSLLSMRWRLNTLFGFSNHSVYSIFFRYWDRAASPHLAEVFVEKRPEYFARAHPGSRNSLSRWQYPGQDIPPQVCATHPGVVEYFAAEAHKVYRGERVVGGYGNHVKRMDGKPWYYPIEEEDNRNWCRCESCSAAFPEAEPGRWYNYLHFDWINRIAAAAAEHDEAVGIAALAYNDYLPYPEPEVLELEPNVAVTMCLGIQSWFHPGVYARQYGAYRDWADNEADRRPLGVWAYLLCPAWDAQLIYNYGGFFPVMYPWQAGRIFTEFARDGVRGYFINTRVPYHILESYVAGKVCFDPKHNAEEIIDEYFKMYYGGAAGPMRRFYRRIEEITWAAENYPEDAGPAVPIESFTHGVHTERVNWHLGTPERMRELQGLIDRALSGASSDVERRRVEWFIDNIWAQAVEGRASFEAREEQRAVPVPEASAAYSGEWEGDAGKVDFSAAEEAGGWALLDGGKLDEQPSLSFVSDSEYLYVMYREEGGGAWEKKDASIWSNNVEMFFAGQPGYPFSQLALSPSGEFRWLRQTVVAGVPRMDDWAGEPAVINKVDGEGWTFKIAIPIEELLPDRAASPGEEIYANFMRTRLFEGGKSLAWSPIFTHVYAQGLYRMGLLTLAVPE